VCWVVAAGFDCADADGHQSWVRAVADPLAPYSQVACLSFLDAATEHRLDDVYAPRPSDGSPL
jgi:hypothetical protein